jgi:hypothetical protein
VRLQFSATCGLALSLVLFAGVAGAQVKSAKSAEDKAARMRGAQDPNIRATRDKVEVNDASKEAPAPPHKGGAKSRGADACLVTIDNRTSSWIEIYADKRYIGTVSSWGDMTVYVYGKTLYARSLFTEAAWTWGPRALGCEPGGSFTWTLKP